MTKFNNRVFGCAIIKSINANYNADFSHQPRTLSNGIVYATDKVLKYSVRNYLNKNHSDEIIFYFKSLNENMQPRDLDQSYISHFGDFPKLDKKAPEMARKEILKNLLKCIDIRLFGGTFASKDANLSIHGPVQFTHGVNRFPEGVIYSEQISSPFRNSSEKGKEDMQATLGTQFKLKEGHYVHHFSINPKNLADMANSVQEVGITTDDISKLKTALCNGVTYYDSAAKAGAENELLLWVELKEGSKLVLPSFIELVDIDLDRNINLEKIKTFLEKPSIKKEIEKIEIYYNKEITSLNNLPLGAKEYDLN